MKIRPRDGYAVVEELGPVQCAMGKRIVVPDCGAFDPGRRATAVGTFRRMRGRVESGGRERTREGVAKAGYRWREDDGRKYAVVAVRELIREEA